MAAFWPQGALGVVVRRGKDGLEGVNVPLRSAQGDRHRIHFLNQDVHGIVSVHCKTLTLAPWFSGYNGSQGCSFAQSGQQGVDQALAQSLRLVEEGMWDQGRAPWFTKGVFT